MIKSPSVQIAALTWNMGNKSATKAAVDDVYRQVVTDPKNMPAVIALATQEELASDKNRLQVKLLKKLNEGKQPGDEGYYHLIETPEAQYHETMAGANNSAKTLVRAVATSQNRVNAAVLVREPFVLENPHARIDYEAGKSKGNKSIITLRGDLKCGDQRIELNISGGHMDSNVDSKRRAHAEKFLENQGIISHRNQPKSFQQILNEAQRLDIVMGDFNERDYLMQNRKTRDQCHQTTFARYGFDMGVRPHQQLGTQTLHGTYGFHFQGNDTNNEQVKNLPDPRSRANVATGGFLDRVAISSGLNVQDNRYGAQLDQKAFQQVGKKWMYHGSDHVPVARNFSVELPKVNNQPEVICAHIKRKVPDLTQEVNDITSILPVVMSSDRQRNKKLNALEVLAVDKIQYHDSKLDSKQFIRAYLGMGPTDKDGDMKRFHAVKASRKQNLAFSMQYLETRLDEMSKGFINIPQMAEIQNINHLLEQYHQAMDKIMQYDPPVVNKKESKADREMRRILEQEQRIAALEESFVKSVKRLTESKGKEYDYHEMKRHAKVPIKKAPVEKPTADSKKSESPSRKQAIASAFKRLTQTSSQPNVHKENVPPNVRLGQEKAERKSKSKP